MSEHVYKVSEVVGSSKTGVDDAVRQAVERAGRTLRNIGWFEVTQVRGEVIDQKVAHWQVGLKIGFRLDQ